MLIWNRRPLLRRLHKAQRKTGELLQKEILAILNEFQNETGLDVQFVNDGEVQRIRGRDNLASLRSEPGRLQIERQVLRNPDKLREEATHEIVAYYAGGLPLPTFGDGPINAQDILESMVKAGPARVFDVFFG